MAAGTGKFLLVGETVYKIHTHFKGFASYETGYASLGLDSFLKRFDGPMDAVVGIFGVGVDYLMQTLAWDVIAVLVVGGALAGILAEWAARRWK